MSTAGTVSDSATIRQNVMRVFAHRRRIAFLVPLLLLVYAVYVVFAFDLPGVASRAQLDNAKIVVADAYSYKYHVTRDYRSASDKVSVEGQVRSTFPVDRWPDWVGYDGDALVINLPRQHEVRFDPDAVRFRIPDYGVVVIRNDNGIKTETPDGTLPDWINASARRVSVTTDAGRLSVTRNRAEVFRYQNGWEQFFFTIDSPFYGRSFGELVDMALRGERIDPESTNLSTMASAFWNNSYWRHKDVAWALFETLLMAFLGTISAAIVALPFAFLAARNFSAGFLTRFGIRRLFDFLRGVDSLVWTIILSRAFGPGPLTGSLALLLTDTGTFGKLFSEALENVDQKQVEGVRSTGANALQRNRFGVIPQIAPVILSQVLYLLESNTRSATVVGAIVGGGIGLLLTQAIHTQQDWEKVAYYIVLTLIMISLMDILSGKLRSRLISRN